VFARLFGDNVKDMLSLTDFLSTVGSLKFRGTSVLFRLPQSALCHLLTRLQGGFAYTAQHSSTCVVVCMHSLNALTRVPCVVAWCSGSIVHCTNEGTLH